MNAHIKSKNNSILSKKQSHVAGEVERGGEPAAGLHIKLPAAALLNFRNRPLESLGVYCDAITHRPEIGEIEDQRPEAGNGPGWRAPKGVDGCPLPRDYADESNGPDESEQNAAGWKR